MRIPDITTKRRGAYTLIEALVASTILLIGVAAAASMSLSMVTQEEINERSVRAFNHLDNAARLYQLGVDPAQIQALLPEEPFVNSLTFTTNPVSVAGIGNIPVTTIAMNYNPTSASVTNVKDGSQWTGGERNVTRTASVDVIRSSSYLEGPLPRVTHFTP